MNILKPFKTAAASVALSLVLMHAPAKAAVDFESNGISSLPLSSTGGAIASGDYTFSSAAPLGIVDGSAYPSFGVSNGTRMLVFSNAGVLTVTRTDNGLFALSSLDVGGWLNLPQPSNSAQLSITGHGQAGDHVIVSSLPTTSFVAVTASPLFTNLTSLTLTMTYGSSAYAAIDNLALTPVPEPESYALFLAGLGLLAVVARRRGSS